MYNELVKLHRASEQIDQIRIEGITILLFPFKKERQSLDIMAALSLACQESLWRQ